MDNINERLINQAENMMKNAYSPYSGFRVGAALLTEDGKIYSGCNVENASYGASICAERTAAVKAISEGAKKFTKIAITGSGKGFTYPCGICRQFLSEFTDDKTEYILKDADNGIKVVNADELLPFAFKKDCME